MVSIRVRHLATSSAYCSRFHKGLKNLLNLKFYKMQIELRILTSQPLTAPPLIADVESCNLIFINADCFDHSVAILSGSLRAPYRRLAVTAIRNTLGTEHSSLPQHTVSTAWLPKGCRSAALSPRDKWGSGFSQGSTETARKEF